MPVVTMRQLLEAGVHFGHQTRRWNPKMKRFIFTERNGIYILDLQQTMTGIERAYTFVRDKVADGGTILFVATKRQVQDVLQEQADRCGMPYVNFRWLGGMLTNFRTIHKRIARMRELEEMVTSGSLDALPKKEALMLRREYEKLARNLRGLRDLNRLPDAIFVLDTKKEEIAMKEAKKLGLPIVAILDTNSDPDDVEFGIPGNDDAIRSGSLLTRIIADAVIEGKSMRPSDGTSIDVSSNGQDKGAAVLPGAAAQPKAEWELQLEAEEQGAEASATTDDTPGGQQSSPDPVEGSREIDPEEVDITGAGVAQKGGGTGTSMDETSEPASEAPSDPPGDEPGDRSHPRPKTDADASGDDAPASAGDS
ncbi:MAG: 30S ribosomal protein S2 [Actinomycetota bacterium]|nr:30S ribosomal protein S2 [Actinomycetota bacterium]